MNKKSSIVVLMLVVSLLLCACGDNNQTSDKSNKTSSTSINPTTKENSTTEVEVVISPTGYPSGEIQQVMIMYNGKLYVSKDNNQNITESEMSTKFEKNTIVGQVQKVSNDKEPDEEYEASRVKEGSNVYLKEDTGELIIYDGCAILLKEQ